MSRRFRQLFVGAMLLFWFAIMFISFGCQEPNPSECSNGDPLVELGRIALTKLYKREVVVFTLVNGQFLGCAISDPEVKIIWDTNFESDKDSGDTIRIRYAYIDTVTGKHADFLGIVDFLPGNCTPIFVNSGKWIFEENIPDIDRKVRNECPETLTESEKVTCVQEVRKNMGYDFSWSDIALTSQDSIEIASLTQCCVELWDSLPGGGLISILD